MTDEELAADTIPPDALCEKCKVVPWEHKLEIDPSPAPLVKVCTDCGTAFGFALLSVVANEKARTT